MFRCIPSRTCPLLPAPLLSSQRVNAKDRIYCQLKKKQYDRLHVFSFPLSTCRHAQMCRALQDCISCIARRKVAFSYAGITDQNDFLYRVILIICDYQSRLGTHPCSCAPESTHPFHTDSTKKRRHISYEDDCVRRLDPPGWVFVY